MRTLHVIGSFLIAGTLWHLFTVLTSVPSYIVPAPYEVFEAVWQSRNEMFRHYRVTALESFLGAALGGGAGFLIGTAMSQSRVVASLTLPMLIASNAIPVIAIAPILIIWFGTGMLSKVMVSAFISFFPLSLNTYKGLTEYDASFRNLFTLYGASELEFLLKFKLPNAVPFILTGLKLTTTLSVIGAIVGEFVSSDVGLGFGILQSSYQFNAPKLWGYVILSCSIGLIFYGAVSLVEKVISNPSNTSTP